LPVSLIPVGLDGFGKAQLCIGQPNFKQRQLATERLAVLRGNQLSLFDHIANPQGRQFNDAVGHSGDGSGCAGNHTTLNIGKARQHLLLCRAVSTDAVRPPFPCAWARDAASTITALNSPISGQRPARPRTSLQNWEKSETIIDATFSLDVATTRTTDIGNERTQFHLHPMAYAAITQRCAG
jgi:hypothetical protein